MCMYIYIYIYVYVYTYIYIYIYNDDNNNNSFSPAGHDSARERRAFASSFDPAPTAPKNMASGDLNTNNLDPQATMFKGF